MISAEREHIGRTGQKTIVLVLGRGLPRAARRMPSARLRFWNGRLSACPFERSILTRELERRGLSTHGDDCAAQRMFPF